MSDPYKVLNISPTATDDEVKHAYRELARKYHPDNYHDNPLADLAQEKMKEINEAYEQIQRRRKNSAGASSASSAAQQKSDDFRYSYTYSDGRRRGSGGSSSDMYEIRRAINMGDISLAERLLSACTDRGAEWNFLKGVVCSRRGWMDEARRYLETACEADPYNEEYQNALHALGGGRYHPAGYHGFGTMTYGNSDCMRLCAAWSCCVLSGGRCFFC